MLKEIVEADPAREMSVHIVWMPMVPGDDAAAARATGGMFAGHRVLQYYDGERSVGLAYRETFMECVEEALAAIPNDHPMYADLQDWAAGDPDERPLWDAVLLYPRGVEWTDRAPKPPLWSKQVGFFGEDAGEVTGLFFRNDCRQPPVESDWHREVRGAARALTSPSRNGSLSSESKPAAGRHFIDHRAG